MEYSGRGATSFFFKCIEGLLQSRYREDKSYYDKAKGGQKIRDAKNITANDSKKRKRPSKKKVKNQKPPPVTVLTRGDCRRLNGLYGARCLVKFKDMGSGSRFEIVKDSDGRNNCFFVAIGSFLFPSMFKSSPMKTGSVSNQGEHEGIVHGLASQMRDDDATVLSCLSNLRADHPYLISIEHMFLGMAPEKDDDPKFIRYHNRSVGEDESGIDVRRTLKAYSAYIRDDDDLSKISISLWPPPCTESTLPF
jgi:hypothetical protein